MLLGGAAAVFTRQKNVVAYAENVVHISLGSCSVCMLVPKRHKNEILCRVMYVCDLYLSLVINGNMSTKYLNISFRLQCLSKSMPFFLPRCHSQSDRYSCERKKVLDSAFQSERKERSFLKEAQENVTERSKP